MAKKKISKKESKMIYEVIALIALIVIGLINAHYQNNETEATSLNMITAEEMQNIELIGENRIQIHFFDVGQGDSILLVSNNKTMLIDASTNEMGSRVVKDIKDLGISKIDYLVGTHPHEDHIGGLDNVIKTFDIGTIYMPKIQANTKTFEDVLDAVSEKGLKITEPKVGDTFKVGDVNCEIMLCDAKLAEDNNNLNLSSIAIRATFDKQSYLFMGDCETENEKSREWP